MLGTRLRLKSVGASSISKANNGSAHVSHGAGGRLQNAALSEIIGRALVGAFLRARRRGGVGEF